MRIGIVTNELPGPGRHGGIARYLHGMLPALQGLGMELQVFAPDAAAHSVIDASTTFVRRSTLVPSDMVSPPDVELAFLAWLATTQPQVVHFHSIMHLSLRLPGLCAAAGVPHVLHLHDVAAFCNQSNFVRNLDVPLAAACRTDVDIELCGGCLLQRGVDVQLATATASSWRERGRQAVCGADAVVYVSQALRDVFERDLGWVARRAHVMLPAMAWPAVPADAAAARASRRSAGSDKPVRFVFLGHVAPVKGLDLLLDAVAELELHRQADDPRFELHVHGDLVPVEPYRSSLREQLAGLRCVHLHGAYKPDELAGILAAADWLVCASRFEASPLVVHEAAHAGVPAIGARVGGVPEKIGQGGLLYEPADTSSCAAALAQALQPATWVRCQSQIVQPPAIHDQAAAIVDLYRHLATRRRAGRAGGTAHGDEAGPVRASVLLVVRNGLHDALACVESMIEAGFAACDELVVVDDCTSDATSSLLAAIEGSVTLISNPSPVGFARACNQGVAGARGEWVITVGANVNVEPGWVDRLVAAAQAAGIHGAAWFELPPGPLAGLSSGLSRPMLVCAQRLTLAVAGGFDDGIGDGGAEHDLLRRLCERAGADTVVNITAGDAGGGLAAPIASRRAWSQQLMAPGSRTDVDE